MRRSIVLPALSAVLFIFSAACSRNDGEYGKVFKGKFLFSGICSNYTIQLLEGDMPPGKIAASWKLKATDSISYSNVFAVSNTCDFDKYKLRQGDIFTFRLDPSPVTGCAVCDAYFPTPPVRNAIRNIKKVN